MILLNKIDVTIQFNGLDYDLVIASLGAIQHTVHLKITNQSNGNIAHNSTFQIPPNQVISLAGYASGSYLMEFTINGETGYALLIIPDDDLSLNEPPIIEPTGGILTVIQGRALETQFQENVFPCTHVYRIIEKDGNVVEGSKQITYPKSCRSENENLSAGVYIIKYSNPECDDFDDMEHSRTIPEE